MQREVFGFAFSGSIADATVGYPSWNFSLLSTVAFFGLHINDNGTIASDSDLTAWNSTQLSDMVTAAHAAGTKVVVSIILQDFGAGNPHMCAGLTNRATTVTATAAQVTAKGVDGVNIDYEGLNATCPNGQTTRAMMTDFAHQLNTALGASAYLSVDTYAGAAADPKGFFDVPGLNAYVDSFFVMAYDLEYSNYSSPPLSCTRFCLGPTSPLAGYRYNDTLVASQYATAVGASKVILGVPYYGRKSCIASVGPHQYPTSAVMADSYLIAKSESTADVVKPGTYVIHRDADDPAGQERWDTWYNTSLGCWRELYWDDTVSLAHKYDLVNTDKLRGVGIFALSYGGGAPELWNLLAAHFTTPFATATVAATQANMQYTVTAGATYNGVVAGFDVISFDLTAGKGRFLEATGVPATSGGDGTWTGTATVYGYPGHQYQYWARAITQEGKASPWSALAQTTVSNTATSSLAFKGLYALRTDGFMKGYTSPPVATWQYWPGQNMARAAHPLPGAASPSVGAVLNAHGSLLSYGERNVFHTSVYWPTSDLARDFAFMPDGTGGYVLDAHGKLWPFAVGGNAMPPAVHGNPTWPTLDIARKVVILPGGTGGYVLDYTGVVNPFGIGSNPVPPRPTLTKHWPGVDFARDIVLIPGAKSGYVLNGYGGLYPFTAPGETAPVVPAGSPYWYGHNVARGFFLLPGSTAASPGGYILDCAAGLTPWGNATGATSGTWSCGEARSVTGG